MWRMVNIGKQIIEPLKVKFMNMAQRILVVDHYAKIRSGRSIPILERRMLLKIIADEKKRPEVATLHTNSYQSKVLVLIENYM